jgi:DNA-binding XRE family transcriptional regulator
MNPRLFTCRHYCVLDRPCAARPERHLGAHRRLKFARFSEAKGLSQEYLTDVAGLHRNFIGVIEHGQWNLTSLALIAISRKLGVPL